MAVEGEGDDDDDDDDDNDDDDDDDDGGDERGARTAELLGLEPGNS